MGNVAQSLKKNGDSMQKYTFLKQQSEQKNLYRNDQTKKQFLAVEKIFPNQEMISNYESQMKKLLCISHPYFLNQTEHIVIASSSMCSIQYRVIHFFQHQTHTLERELQTRKNKEKYFSEKQIWSILCSVVLAMSHLTKNEIIYYSLHPKDLVIDETGMIKILSPLLIDQSSQQVVDCSAYYSPQHLKAIKNQSFQNLSNKSSVFTLGITLLHTLSLEPMNELYNYESCSINVELLHELIDKLSESEIKQVIKKMVKLHGYDRITFTELQDMLYDLLEGDQEDQENKNNDLATLEENGFSKLSASIHTIYQTVPQITVKEFNSRLHPTGASTFRQSNSQKLSKVKFQQFLNAPDNDDKSALLVSQSEIDVQKIDQEDTKLQSETQSESNRFPQSILSERPRKNEINSILFQPEENKLFRSDKNVCLEKSSIYQAKCTQTKNLAGSLLETNQNQASKPYHVREQLKRGVYKGYKINGMRHGFGVFYYAQGGKYAGEWVKNKMQGTGALYYVNDQIAYEGQWHNDRLHGSGVLYNQLPNYQDKPFDYKNLHLIDNFWVKYEGNFFEDEKNGEGALFLSNGEYYKGQFHKDFPHGNGTFKSMNGSFIKGNWILGMMQ